MSESRVVIITRDGYEAVYGRKLFALLAERSINSVLWTEQAYLSNRPQFTNKERLIFFGLGAETRKQAAIINNWVFDSYGCRIGWLGNVCVITARDFDLPWGDLKEFSEYCRTKAGIHPDIPIPSDNPVGEVMNVIGDIVTDKKINSARRAQYNLLVYEFLDNWIDGFLNKKDN